MHGKLTGAHAEDEMIALRIQPYKELWKAGSRDAKTLASWTLYEGLNRPGILEEYRSARQEKRARKVPVQVVPIKRVKTLVKSQVN